MLQKQPNEMQITEANLNPEVYLKAVEAALNEYRTENNNGLMLLKKRYEEAQTYLKANNILVAISILESIDECLIKMDIDVGYHKNFCKDELTQVELPQKTKDKFMEQQGIAWNLHEEKRNQLREAIKQSFEDISKELDKLKNQPVTTSKNKRRKELTESPPKIKMARKEQVQPTLSPVMIKFTLTSSLSPTLEAERIDVKSSLEAISTQAASPGMGRKQ